MWLISLKNDILENSPYLLAETNEQMKVLVRFGNTEIELSIGQLFGEKKTKEKYCESQHSNDKYIKEQETNREKHPPRLKSYLFTDT